MQRTYLRVGAMSAFLVALVCIGFGCSSGGDNGAGTGTGTSLVPPFNSIDTTVSCPAGQVGWNFSTGGSDLTQVAGSSLSGVQVLTASYGNNCTPNAQANSTAVAEGQCNGLASCPYKIGLSYDPAYGCRKDFDTTWQCGADSTVYSGHVNGESGGQSFTYTCAPQIHIVSGTYGANCNPPIATGGAGNKDTIALTQACDGKRVCSYTENNTGPDPRYLCPKDFEAKYTCGNGSNVYSASIPGEANGKTLNFTCPVAPTVNIVVASYGTNCNSNNYQNRLPDVTALCSGKASCQYTVGGPDPSYGCAKWFEGVYTCGDNPQLISSFINAEAGGKTATFDCSKVTAYQQIPPATETGQKGCIPQTCRWNQVRDAQENCVVDPNKQFTTPYMYYYKLTTADGNQAFNNVDLTPAQINATINNQPGGVGISHLLSDTPYTLAGTLIMTNAENDTLPVEGTLEPWMSYRFHKNSDGSEIDGFLCALSPIHVKTQAAGTNGIQFSVTEPIPSQCFDARTNPFADAAARLSMNENDFRKQYTYAYARMHFTLDPENAFSFPNSQGSINAPNPPGFFFNPQRNFTDLVAFYQQRELLTTQADYRYISYASKGLPPQNIPNGAIYSLFASKYLQTVLTKSTLRAGSALTVDFFAPQGPPISVDVGWELYGDNPLSPFSPNTSAPVAGIPNLAQRNLRATVEIYPSGNPGVSMVVGSIPLSRGAPAGAIGSGTLPLPAGVRDQIFGPWLGNTSFGLKTCIDADGVNTRSGAAYLSSNGYYADIFGPGSGSACITQDNVITVSRSLIERPIIPQQGTANVANTDNSAKGDSSNTAHDGSGQQKSCTRVANANGTTKSSTCTATQSSTSSAEGAFPVTYYSTTSTSSTTNTTGEGSTDSGNTAVGGEALGYQVLDPNDGDDNLGWMPTADVGHGTHTFTIAPNWGAIKDAINGPEAAAPGVHPEATTGTYGGHMGLGVGIGYRQLITPFGQINLTASVGVSIGLTFNWTNVQPTAYPCINTNGATCYGAVGGPVSQSDASKACEVAGGQLAEISSTNAWNGLQGAATANKGYWVGGQLDYEFSTPACARNQGSAQCIGASTTHYRWLNTDSEFAKSSSISAPQFFSNELGAPQANFNLASQVPTAAGVQYNGASKQFTSVNAGTANTPLCQFDGAASTSYSQFDIIAQIGAGAGIGLAWCWPTEDVGVCIQGSLQIIGIEIDPQIHHYSTSLYDTNSRLFGTRADTAVLVPWTASLLSGEVDFVANFLFFSVSYKLFQYPGYVFGTGNLAQYDWPSRENF